MGIKLQVSSFNPVYQNVVFLFLIASESTCHDVKLSSRFGDCIWSKVLDDREEEEPEESESSESEEEPRSLAWDF